MPGVEHQQFDAHHMKVIQVVYEPHLQNFILCF